jgi:hypothetical protein
MCVGAGECEVLHRDQALDVGRETGRHLHTPKPLAHGPLLICREVVAHSGKVHFPALCRRCWMNFGPNVLVHKIQT